MISFFYVVLRFLLLGGFLTITVLLSASTAVAREQIVWEGVETFVNRNVPGQIVIGPPPQERNVDFTTIINFRYVEEVDSEGRRSFISRKIRWKVTGSSEVYSVRGERTLMARVNCENVGDELEFGPSSSDVGSITPDQAERLKVQCDEWYWHKQAPGRAQFGYWPAHPENIRIPKLERRDCYSEPPPERPGYTYRVGIAREFDVVMDVKTDSGSDYFKFVPGPREKIWFSVRSNIPVRLQFQLDKVSRFPGYATNANVDDAFFYRYTLDHLKQRGYPNNGPDLIFDPKDFEDTGVWKRTAWDKVETVELVTSISVPITALDFGAYGRLKAVATPRCGPGKPVKIRVGGQERQFVTIPMDEDGNLIADRMDKPNNGKTAWDYKGDPGRDDDQIPKGNGIQGDGFTAFEEYRGFIRSDGHCGDPKQDIHFRSDPTKKDLFIAPENADLASIARKFGDATGLTVYLICPRHYNNKRVVNFTLQDNRIREWQGKTLSQEEPQHGLSFVQKESAQYDLEGYEKRIGSPKYVNSVEIGTKFSSQNEEISLGLHQLGHAVGIRHHGEDDIWPAAVVDVSSCPQGTSDRYIYEGTMDGKLVCVIYNIALPHGQRSGDQECPMRSGGWEPEWYVPPSSPFDYLGKGNILITGGYGAPPAGANVWPLPLYRMRVMKYQRDRDPPGVGKFCTSKKGTGINAPGDESHAGDSTRICAEQICVNDVRCPRPTP